MKIRNRHFSSFQIITLGFLAVILAGSLLLMLPAATVAHVRTPFPDALFTATSAVCVTGLVVFDTATYWSMFGQAVILIMIQIGGMGVVTIAVAIVMFSGRKISLKQRGTMQEAIGATHVGGIVRLTGFILKVSLAIEAGGALLMAPVFCKEMGIGKGIWYALFHSISAFCNAGFDLMGVRSPYSSLTGFSGNWLINVTVMLLIITGGIGFLTWEDVHRNKLHFRRYRMQSKVILGITAILIVLPAIYFYLEEFSRPAWQDLTQSQRILGSMFQAVTPRTAGFNTVDLTKLTQPGQAIIMILMLIGGSPGSTAGGMKTTTLAVLFASSIAVFRRREDGHFFGRRFSLETTRYASTIFMMYVTLFMTGGILISMIEGIPMQQCLFETASAIGTVGLSLGLTGELGTVSHLILICLMYCGRVGGLTLIYAAQSNMKPEKSKFPQEKITVG